MTPKNLEDLYIHQLRDLYSAETQLDDALNKMAEKATNEQLQNAFRQHRTETSRHRERLERIFEGRGMSPAGVACKAIKGLIKEAEENISDSKSFLGADAPPEVLDASLIADAQRVEHYEISAYGTVRTYAEILGRSDEHQLLSETLSEEKSADSKLNAIALEIVNPAAASA
jgi:ferritin-like metal-binding protein YciE